MYRYLHGCKVAKSCGMLQVADPRAAAEELVNPARPLHSRPEWFYHLKGENKEWTALSSPSQERKTGDGQFNSY